jgi:hypothetical protein
MVKDLTSSCGGEKFKSSQLQPRLARQLLSLYSPFYNVIMLESTNAIGEGKMQIYF